MKRIAWTALAGAVLLAGAPVAAETQLSGDRIDGTAVVEQLDAATLPRGQVHRFWFRASDSALGQGWYVPVVVVQGARPGKRLLLTAGIHGDELNGIDVIQQLANRIDPARLSGTLVMVPGLNTPGLNNSTRNFTPTGGTAGANLNRVMPGKDEADAGLADRYDWRLWHNLMRPNADQMIDLHTQSRGTAYVLYAFVSSPEARRIAELIGPDVLRLDPGVRGTVENEMVPAGIPAITLEIGHPEIFDARMNARALDGILRVMADMGMIAAADAPALSGPGAHPFVANRQTNVAATRGGWARLSVALNDDVREGQVVATISDPFGRVLATLRSPVNGRVAAIATDPRVANGDMLVRIGYHSDDPACARGCD